MSSPADRETRRKRSPPPPQSRRTPLATWAGLRRRRPRSGSKTYPATITTVVIRFRVRRTYRDSCRFRSSPTQICLSIYWSHASDCYQASRNFSDLLDAIRAGRPSRSLAGIHAFAELRPPGSAPSRTLRLHRADPPPDASSLRISSNSAGIDLERVNDPWPRLILDTMS